MKFLMIGIIECTNCNTRYTNGSICPECEFPFWYPREPNDIISQVGEKVVQ